MSLRDRSVLERTLSFTVGVVLLLIAAKAPADEYPRDARVDVLRYVFDLELNDESDEIVGSAEIRIRLTEPGVQQVGLDLIGSQAGDGMQVTAVSGNGEPLEYRHENDRVTIELGTQEYLVGGELTLRVQYHGVPADGLVIGRNKYGDRTFFGDNWPNRARHWLPTVDHVSDKALVDFVVTSPPQYQVVANGRLVETTDLDDGRRRTHWSCSVPLPPKVMVIGAARFAVEHLPPVDGVPVQTWVYPQDREAGFFDFRQAPAILAFFSDHVGEYPYSKLANVQSKTRFGGMENAGNIFYSERAIRGDGSNEELIAHEIAHQWFGDSVTEADWNHVWLSEGFATYFTALYMEHAHGSADLRKRMVRAREAVLRFFDRAPDSPIIDERITELNSLLSTNSYQKGGWVLHMLRREVGDEVFWRGIREYYRRYRDANALSADFRAVMEAAAGRDLGWFFEQWLFSPGQPSLGGHWAYDAQRSELILVVEQRQPGERLFRVSLDIGILRADGRLQIDTMQLDERRHELRVALAAAPLSVTLDPNTWLLYSAGGFGER